MKVLNKFSATLVAAVVTLSLGGIQSAHAATSVDLGTADNFAILGGSTVTNTGSSVITGDLGLSPGTSVTGFPPGTLNGTQHVADTTAATAKTDLVTAYNDAAGQTPVTTVPTELGGTTLTAGSYNSTAGTFGITGTLTLDAAGNADAVFIFKTASTLITAGSSTIVLTNGAQACNVFWQVGSSATLGIDSTFKGNILALTSITATTRAAIEGSLLARNGAVTLDTNVITRAVCVVPPTPPIIPETPAVPPLINVLKVPTPLALPDGPGSVTYAYTVTNVGTVAMNNVTVTDDKCTTVTFVSGDTDADAFLDTTETWTYTCTRTLSNTMTNTVTATGQGNGFTAIDTANATVVVGAVVVPPLINLVKIPDESLLAAGGGAVTYTYTVTNPGTVPLTDVSVVDDSCAPVTYVSGDDNGNDNLNVGETWTYTCTSNLTATTTNTGTAQGSANGFTAVDFSVVTVVVAPSTTTNTNRNTNTNSNTNTTNTNSTTTNTNTTTNSTTSNTNTTSNSTTPTLPNTGVGPQSNHLAQSIAAVLGLVMFIVTSTVVVLKKRAL